MNSETMAVYDRLAALKRQHAGDAAALRVLDALAERVEADGLTLADVRRLENKLRE